MCWNLEMSHYYFLLNKLTDISIVTLNILGLDIYPKQSNIVSVYKIMWKVVFPTFFMLNIQAI